MDSDIAALMLTNHAPSDELLARACGYLAKEEAEVAGMDIVIRGIEQALIAAKSIRDEAKERIRLYRAVSSPIRCLPDDILREIFLLSLSTTRNPIISAVEAPLLLTHICSAWRNVALSSPRIWARLHIPIPGNNPSDIYALSQPQGIYSGHKITGYAEAMANRRTIIQDWLSRSGDCPLSLSIHEPTFQSSDEEPNGPVEGVLQTLLLHVGRWKELELAIPTPIYHKFQALFSISSASSLETLRICLYEQDRDTSAKPIPLLSAPKLLHLAINALPFTACFMRSLAVEGQLEPQWQNIASLALLSCICDTELVVILKLMPNLVHCRVATLTERGLTNVVQHFPSASLTSSRFDTPHTGVIHLPRLETLNINDRGSPVVVFALLGAIEARSLKRLEYNQNAMLLPQPNNNPTYLTSPFIRLIDTCAPTLQELAWGSPDTEGLLACLRIPERLCHVILGHKPLQTGPNTHRLIPHPLRPPVEYAPLLASLAVPESIETAQETSKCESTPILLPYLQTLEIYRCVDLTDELVLQVIRSRILRYIQGPRSSMDTQHVCASNHPILADSDDPLFCVGIAALQRVVISFDRKIQIDIKPEIERLAKEAGIAFHLELSYPSEMCPSERPSRFNMLTTSYGVGNDGTTWPQPTF